MRNNILWLAAGWVLNSLVQGTPIIPKMGSGNGQMPGQQVPTAGGQVPSGGLTFGNNTGGNGGNGGGTGGDAGAAPSGGLTEGLQLAGVDNVVFW